MDHPTTRAGVSVAIPAGEMPQSRADAEEFAGMLTVKLADDLAKHTASARSIGEVAFHMSDKPHADPLQGLIYVASLSAEYRVEDLPSHSTAYQAHIKENRA